MGCSAASVAALLGAQLHGPDVEVLRPCSLEAIAPGTLVFAKALTPERLERLGSCDGALALVVQEFVGRISGSFIVVPNPRLAFARVVEKYFLPVDVVGVAPTAHVDSTALLGVSVSIGRFSTIGAGVTLGDRTHIRDHVVIAAGTTIGADCLIKSHSVIGEEGFGFEIDAAGTPIRIPHIGSVVIGSEVEVGAGTVVARGTLGSTRIGDRVKIDDLVFIAHNAQVGDDTLIIANAEISGSVRIGRRCWIGPSASIINAVTIGDDALVGIGAVVTKSVDAGVVVAGNPARVLRMRVSQRDPNAKSQAEPTS